MENFQILVKAFIDKMIQKYEMYNCVDFILNFHKRFEMFSRILRKFSITEFQAGGPSEVEGL